jgi:hypothetical protein
MFIFDFKWYENEKYLLLIIKLSVQKYLGRLLLIKKNTWSGDRNLKLGRRPHLEAWTETAPGGVWWALGGAWGCLVADGRWAVPGGAWWLMTRSGAGGELEEGREEAVCFAFVLGKLISLKCCNIYIL